MAIINVANHQDMLNAAINAQANDTINLTSDIDLSDVRLASGKTKIYEFKNKNIKILGNNYAIKNYVNTTNTVHHLFTCPIAFTTDGIYIYNLQVIDVLNVGILVNCTPYVYDLIYTAHLDCTGNSRVIYGAGSANGEVIGCTMSISGTFINLFDNFSHAENTHIYIDVALSSTLHSPLSVSNALNCSITGVVRVLTHSNQNIAFYFGSAVRYLLLDLDLVDAKLSLTNVRNEDTYKTKVHYTKTFDFSLIYIRNNTSLASITNSATSVIYDVANATTNNAGFIARSVADIENKQNYLDLGWVFGDG